MSRHTAPIHQDAPVSRGGVGDNSNSLRPGGELGFLAVQVFFHEEPVEHLAIFFVNKKGKVVNPNDEPVRTDQKGIARLEDLAPVGLYDCRIRTAGPGGPHMERTISTVEDPAKPFIIVLPVGRPYFDIAGNWEFTRD
jgi:hypothetical protein